MSLDSELEPDWVNDYDEPEDDFDSDQDRDRRADEAAEDRYDRWIKAHMGWDQ